MTGQQRSPSPGDTDAGVGRPAVVFPGQGSQREGMRDLVTGPAKGLLDVARRACGGDPFDRLDEGTHMVQPALFVVGVASWLTVRESLHPVALAGHSLGELAALVAAGALEPEDGVRLAAARGSITREVARRQRGGMLAVGLDPEDARAFAERHRLTVANDNAPRQVVLSGSDASLIAAEEDAERSRLRHRRLAVDGPFHSAYMEEAAERFSAELERVELAEPRTPVFSCVTARPFEDVRRQLAQSLTSPVRWREIVETLCDDYSVDRIVEAAPGKVLTGLVRRIRPDVARERLDAPVAVEPSARAESSAR